MLSLLLELNTSCSSCGNPLPINGFVENIYCGKCNKENVITSDLWSSLLEDKSNEIKSFAEKDGRTSQVMTGKYNFEMLYGRRVPRCGGCKTEIPENELNGFSESGNYKCKNCSIEIFIRPATKSLISIFPSAKYIVGEDIYMLMNQTDKPLKPDSYKPTLFNCPSCAGSLEVDGTSRLVICKYCESKIYLPDDIWFTLHPVVTKQKWFITFDDKIESELLPKWENNSDVAIDSEGNIYFAGTDDSSSNEFFIWSATPDLKKRWEAKEIKLKYENTHLAITKSGTLYVWDSSKPSMYVLSCKDGSIIKTINGSPNIKDNYATFTLMGCNALISDSDETILALINSTFVRFNSDGTRASLWDKFSGQDQRSLFSKLFSRDDSKIQIPESNASDVPSIDGSGNKPQNMDSYNTKMFLGWDDFIYFYNTDNTEFTIAKYNRGGEKIWSKKIESYETGDKICADAKGNVFIIGCDEDEKSKLMRLSPDGKTIDIVLKDITEGGTLRYDSGDMVLVSPEGVIYTFNSNEQLRIFNPDFSVKYISRSCKEDDEDLLEDLKSN